MGLRDAARKAVLAAVGAAGDIAVSTDYQAFVSSGYDASAGVDTVAYATTAGVRVIFQDFRVEQVDGSHILAADKTALIAAGDLSGVNPGVNDRLIEGSTVWQVQRATTDPAGALHRLHVRKA